MKKRSLLLFMTLLFLYALTACAGEDNGSVPPGGGLAAASGGGAVVMEAPEAAVQDGLNFSACLLYTSGSGPGRAIWYSHPI